MIGIGSSELKGLKIGDTDIKKVYHGSSLIWEKSGDGNLFRSNYEIVSCADTIGIGQPTVPLNVNEISYNKGYALMANNGYRTNLGNSFSTTDTTKLLYENVIDGVISINNNTGNNYWYFVGFPIQVEADKEHQASFDRTDIYGDCSLVYFDENGLYVSGLQPFSTNFTFTAPSNAKYTFIIFRSYKTDSSCVFSNISIRKV